MITKQLRLLAGVGVVGLLLLSAISISYKEYGEVGLQAVSVVATSLLTLGLVALYYEQHSVLRSQQEPHLEISEFHLTNAPQNIDAKISNYGGGPATSLRLVLEFYQLDGKGPIDEADGLLRRIDSESSEIDSVTRSSSIKPNEIGIPFELQSTGVIGMGSRTQHQRSLGKIVHQHLQGRDVLYAKILIEYKTVFATETYSADFSIKFTEYEGDIRNEVFTYLPWREESTRNTLGG